MITSWQSTQMEKQFIKDHSLATSYSIKHHNCGIGMITKTTPVLQWGTQLFRTKKHCFRLRFSCQATLLSPQCCLVSTHLTSLEWREICALPQPPPSWCRSRCPPVTLGNSLVMMDSASPLTRDATRYHTAGNAHHIYWERSIFYTSVGPNSKFGPNTEYRICSGFENELNTNTE